MSGDNTFERHLAAEQAFLVAFVRALGVPVADAGDVVQNANVYLVRHRDDFVPGTNFRAWASRVVRYRCLHYFREQRRRPMINISEEALDLVGAEMLEQYDETAAQLVKLRRCLERLSPESRLLLDAVYKHGQTLKEYAARNDMSHDAARKAISRVREALKTCIERSRSD